MAQDDSESFPTPESIASYVKKNTSRKRMGAAMHMHGGETLREDDYKGHHIIVKSTYTIEVDGKPVTGHLVLTNEGQVQYHGLPNMSFDSTIDLVRSIIDHFPADFAAPEPGAPATPQADDGAMPGMAGMPGMKAMKKAAPVKKPAPAKAKR